jgi:hypothetical protein
MKPEKRLLLHELLEGDGDCLRRQTTLLAGARVLRRRRWRRFGIQTFGLMALISIMGFSAHKLLAPRRPSITANSSASSSKTFYLTDDELLALFSNTPVAMATVNGRKILIFPRPSDQAKYVRRW